ncbi:MAG: molybdopterin-synthase adenylyltransferase MoeB [Candidatus Competibacter sp.]|nr:molybdopterin-synthase adenylyltransferase MoeB [Candidatus Competibacter sp.]MDG4584135.1 molybdopterin-synthase adenylyltransferase MoeB [Candidatus Competibacter sp.]
MSSSFHQSPNAASALGVEEQLRYARHLILPEIGLDGQRKLRQASVLVIGAGGLGTPALLYLAAAGVGRLGIIDPDRVELSNLQRQVLYDTAGCGAAKVEHARDRLLALNPHLQIDVYPEAFTLANAARLVEAYDLLIEGSDRFATKYLVNDACALAGKPYVGASIRAFSGMLSVYAAPGGPCYRCLFPEPPGPETVPSCAQAGVLGTVPGLFGTLQAHEALKLILGIGEPLIGTLLTVDLLAMRFQKPRLPRDPDCPVCGEAPTIRALAETEWVCADTSELQTDGRPATVRTMSTDGLPWLGLEAGRRRPALRWIDVRTEAEFAAGHIPGAEHVPLDRIESLPARVGPDEELLLYCQRGERTVRAYRLLGERLKGRLSLLEGGYEAWLRVGPAGNRR